MKYIKVAFTNAMLILLTIWSILTFSQIYSKGHIKFIEPNKKILITEYALSILMIPYVIWHCWDDIKKLGR